MFRARLAGVILLSSLVVACTTRDTQTEGRVDDVGDPGLECPVPDEVIECPVPDEGLECPVTHETPADDDPIEEPFPEVQANDALDPSGTDTPNPVTLDPQHAIGLNIIYGDVVPTGASGSDSSFRFPSGVISARDVWSPDNGVTWQADPPPGYVDPGPGQDGAETAIHLGGYEIYSPSSAFGVTASGFAIGGRRSTGNWQQGTVTSSPANVDAPKLVSLVGDDGAFAGYGRIQDLIHLTDGRIMAAAYGRYANDTIPWDTYDHVPGRYKVRAIALFSPLGDKGRTWGSPVTIASRFMLTRGGNEAANAHKAVGLMQAQEGPGEAALSRTPAGDIICVMRTGHRKGAAPIGMPFFQMSPYYIAVTEDEGKTWSLPRQVRTASETLSGGNPKLILLGNGVNVLAGPDNRGGYIAFSTNGGATWNARSYLTRSNVDLDLRRIGFNTFQVYYLDNTLNQRAARTITVHRTGQEDEPLLDFYAEGPSRILPGQSSRLTYWGQNVSNLTIQGGDEWPTKKSTTPNHSAVVGPLWVTTTYTLRHEASDTTRKVTITVN